MRFAFADPPYIGQAKRHYGRHPDFAGEVDHAEMIARLVRDYPDGWALSCSSPSLRVLLPLCPEKTRVLAWTKPFAFVKPGVFPGYAWEPVLLYGGRKPRRNPSIVADRLHANPQGVTGDRNHDAPALPGMAYDYVAGAKPEAFCFWIFDVLGATPQDTLEDLFPGSGAVSRAWRKWCERQRGLGLDDMVTP